MCEHPLCEADVASTFTCKITSYIVVPLCSTIVMYVIYSTFVLANLYSPSRFFGMCMQQKAMHAYSYT